MDTQIVINDKTRLLLDHYRVAPWFSKVGQRCHSAAKTLKDWDEVNALCNEYECEEMLIEAGNKIPVQIDTSAPERLSKWNALIVLVGKHVDEIINVQMRANAAWRQMDKRTVALVKWSMVSACMEVQYEQYLASDFFRRLIKWYMEGHIPCGWVGSLESGQPIVY